MITNRSMPPGVIIPELPYQDVGTAATWLYQTFGFKERLRIGNHRCQLTFGESSIVVIERKEAGVSSMMIHVDEIDVTMNELRSLAYILSVRQRIILLANDNILWRISAVIAGRFRKPSPTLIQQPGVECSFNSSAFSQCYNQI